ncbi:hypothetical protein OUZ56_005818 [Daphnia magna]|uniref:Uncharacterized protein n=1 Tax=Daphnia magna TaxID=35525 RepID=A0ABQ9YV81_9CRUS|nr:hypothetical protein OUZ56_005818 [Daphnia magna]
MPNRGSTDRPKMNPPIRVMWGFLVAITLPLMTSSAKAADHGARPKRQPQLLGGLLQGVLTDDGQTGVAGIPGYVPGYSPVHAARFGSHGHRGHRPVGSGDFYGGSSSHGSHHGGHHGGHVSYGGHGHGHGSGSFGHLSGIHASGGHGQGTHGYGSGGHGAGSHVHGTGSTGHGVGHGHGGIGGHGTGGHVHGAASTWHGTGGHGHHIH